MGVILKNNAVSTITTAISASDVGLAVAAGTGSLFPTLGAGDYFYATLVSTGGTYEVVKVTARVSDTMTIVRAQEGTTAQSFASGSRLEARVTAASITDMVDEHDQASEISFVQSGTGAATRTVEDKIREWVSPEDFSGTDTAKLQAALDTGKPVRCSSSGYTINGALTLKENGQVLDFNGALVTATGSFNLFNFTAGKQGMMIEKARIEAAALTGYVFNAVGIDRLTLTNMRVFNPDDFAYVEQCNVVEMNNVWVNNIRGDYGIRWYGETAKRSDILRLIGVNLSFPGTGTGTGIDWDGNCHTLQAFGVTIVQPNKGVVIRNSSAGTEPEFGFFTNIEIDFPESYGVEILSGENYYFGPQFYCHGSTTASGILVDASIPDDRVAFYGGKISDHADYGIENNTRVMVCNLVLTDNSTADFLDPDEAYLTAPRLEIDGTYFLRRTSGGDPVLQFDANDFIGYNRSANDFFTQVGGVTRLQISADNNAVRLMVDGLLKQLQVGAADSGGTGFRMIRVPN